MSTLKNTRFRYSFVDSVIFANISSDKATFGNAAPFYNDVLSASGYKENLTYPKDLSHSDRIRQRKTIWFYPPYNVNLEKNFGKTFL